MDKKNPRRLFFVLLFFGALFAVSAETLALSLDSAVEKALAQSINLQKSAIDLELAQYRTENLWAELFPSFSLGGGLTLLPNTPLFTEPGFRYNADGLSYSVNFGVSMQFSAGIPHSMKITELAYRTGLLNYENAKNRVVLDITKNFNTLLAGQVHLSNLSETLGLAELQYEKNQVAHQNGLIGELPLLQSRLAVETARFDLNNARGTWENSLHEFLAALGLDRDTEVSLEGEIIPVRFSPDSEALILKYLPGRPDIVNQRQAIERLEISAEQGALSAKAPSLSLSARWAGSPQNNSGLAGKFTDSLSASLSVSVPIDPWIPGTRSNTNLRASEAELEKARLDLANIEAAAKTQIRSYCENLRNYWENIRIVRLRVEIAERAYELSEAGFRNGTVEFLSLEATRTDLADARYRLLQSELQYQNTVLDLASALNIDPETLTRSGE
jgi:outer membrane protein TolC